MTQTIENVLKGVAILELGAPAGNRAEWSTEQFQTGSHSVKLSKGATGDYGSTGIQITASGNAKAQTIQDFSDQTLTWGWDYFRSAIAAYWEMMELHFEDPNSESWVDITVQVDVMATGGAVWVTKNLDATDFCFYGGWSELDGSFSDYTAKAISGVVALIESSASLQNAVTGIATWLLTRIKMEMWETVWARSVYVDNIVIDGITYTLEPGDTTTEGILLTAPFTPIGYTEDGVIFTYTADMADIEVDEETVPIDRVIIKETMEVTCNMAEASLFNMDKAMAGSVLSGSILKLGGGVNKKITLQIKGTTPKGKKASILMPSCTATGAVGMPFKKDEKVVVPVTFQALKTANHPACTIVYNAA